jgi:hypothetical protein
MACVKPSSILAGLPSIKGEAVKILYQKINYAIEEDRNTKASKSKSKKPRRSQKDIRYSLTHSLTH